MCSEWRIISQKGNGNLVERDGHRGFAKLSNPGREKLAHDLAMLVGVNVPFVEVCYIGKMGPFSVSHIHSATLGSLREDALTATPYSPDEQTALRAASGLLPFLAWVGADDHYKDENLVVDDLDPAGLNISAIDFDDAFSFALETDCITAPVPPSLKIHFDKVRVGETLEKILNLSEAEIMSCCAASADWLSHPQQVAEALIARRKFLKQAMSDAGWLT